MLRTNCDGNSGLGEDSGNVVVLGMALCVERRGEVVSALALTIVCPDLRECARATGNTEVAPLISTAYIEFAIIVIGFKVIRRNSCTRSNNKRFIHEHGSIVSGGEACWPSSFK